jgi:hypothetical protein
MVRRKLKMLELCRPCFISVGNILIGYLALLILKPSELHSEVFSSYRKRYTVLFPGSLNFPLVCNLWSYFTAIECRIYCLGFAFFLCLQDHSASLHSIRLPADGLVPCLVWWPEIVQADPLV